MGRGIDVAVAYSLRFRLRFRMGGSDKQIDSITLTW